MQVKCEYCDSYYDDDEEKCPYCGATNAHLNRTAKGVPRTIEELKEYCIQHNIPTARLRLFIGQDYKGPKAYGIYQDGENFIVYKNKSDGTRAIRYDGTDESYAVNELYQKIRERIVTQAENNPDFRENTSDGSDATDIVSDLADMARDVVTSATESFDWNAYHRRWRRRMTSSSPRHRRRGGFLLRHIWLIIVLIWLAIALGSACNGFYYDSVDGGYEIYWDSDGYDDDGDSWWDDDDDWDDWDDGWDDYDYDWDDWDDGWDDWDSDW